MPESKEIPSAPLGCPAFVEFVNSKGDFAGLTSCQSRADGKCHLKGLKSTGFIARTPDRPCALERDTRQAGDLFIGKLNHFLASTGEEGIALRINPSLFEPLFTTVITKLQDEGKSTKFFAVMTAANLKLYGDSAEIDPSNYTLQSQTLNNISTYILESSAIREEYVKLDVRDIAE